MRHKRTKTKLGYYKAVGGILTALYVGFIANHGVAFATQAAAPSACQSADSLCLLGQEEADAAKITDAGWRDQIYRELAKLYTAKGDFTHALGLLPKIQTPDTEAMTIRGIGMAAARLKRKPDELKPLFTSLRNAADKIQHPPSQGIALTYIAMAQAFAGDDDGAYATAKAMINDALRHKALGESAEIQAERGDLQAATKSLNAIEDLSFRNKAYAKVARTFADQGQYDNALAAIKAISNDYERSQTMVYMLTKQITPGETGADIKTRPGEDLP